MNIDQIIETAGKYHLSLDKDTAQMLANHAVCAFGSSGGKDSDAMVLETSRFLQAINHTGQKVIIHSDLGMIEHADSLPQCVRLAQKTGFELIVVKPRIDMLGRWEQRWRDNTNRYINLSCVKLITPYSSASLRFCTGELKVAPICSELKKRFPGQQIINAVGIRAEESPARAKKPISKVNKLLTVKTKGTSGRDWHPVRDFLLEDVWLSHRRASFAAHEGYAKNGNERISCSVCVLAGSKEIKASMRDVRNHESYRRGVRLEVLSTYSFSQSFYLGDVCPELLDAKTREELAAAKEKAKRRIEIEKEIPPELLYVKGWPTFQPDLDQAGLIASVRRRIGELMHLPVKHTGPGEVYDRYRELLIAKAVAEAKKKIGKKALIMRQAAKVIN